MNCYLSRNYKGITSAGNKAKSDIEAIMSEMHYKNVGLKKTTYRNSIIAFLYTLAGVLKSPFCLHKGDNLVLQYPLKKYFALVCKLAHIRGARVIVIIHDLGSFRRKKLTIEKEIKRLNNADCIIAHNDKMKKWLELHDCKAKILTLGIFDYLSETKATEQPSIERPFNVIYAGALAKRKNTFIYNLGKHLGNFKLNLYGSGFEAENAEGIEHIRYMGFVQSDQLIATANGHFGLVWDGASIDGCTGDFGEYLQYNNPHKTSLYIRCEIPVIIWRKAALASFVEREQIGLCIDSLAELDTLLQKLSIEEYKAMKERTKIISRRLAEGHYAKQAITAAINELGKQ